MNTPILMHQLIDAPQQRSTPRRGLLIVALPSLAQQLRMPAPARETGYASTTRYEDRRA